MNSQDIRRRLSNSKPLTAREVELMECWGWVVNSSMDQQLIGLRNDMYKRFDKESVHKLF
jgi:hypothetical protein